MTDEVKKLSIDEHITKQGIFCEIKAITVDHDYSHEGIASNMIRLVLENSKKQGFRALITASSNNYLTRALLNNSGSVEKSFKLNEWQYNPGMIFKKDIPFKKAIEPHDKFDIVVVRFLIYYKLVNRTFKPCNWSKRLPI